MNHKGRGVRTTKCFNKGDILLEYHGELISADEGMKREYKKEAIGCQDCYTFFFKHALVILIE